MLMTSSQTMGSLNKLSARENSTRILLGSKPGKKKKKRGYMKDMALLSSDMPSSVSKKLESKPSAKKLPLTLEGHKM